MSSSALSGTPLDRLGHAVLDTASEAIVFADREGVIRFWNPGAERLFGFTAAEAVGRSLDIIIPEPQRARHWAGFPRVMETGQSHYGQGDVLAVPGLRRDGTRISLEFTIVPLHDQAGRLEGIAAIQRDATERFEEMRVLRREPAVGARGDLESAAGADRVELRLKVAMRANPGACRTIKSWPRAARRTDR